MIKKILLFYPSFENGGATKNLTVPSTDYIIRTVKEENPNEIILLPLYPQFSASTSGSSIKEWNDLCKKENLNIKTKPICCYPTEKNFLVSHAELIKKTIKNLDKNFKLLFSAHGLPENKIKKGDPYQWQVEQTVEAIMFKLKSEDLDYIINSVKEFYE